MGTADCRWRAPINPRSPAKPREAPRSPTPRAPLLWLWPRISSTAPGIGIALPKKRRALRGLIGVAVIGAAIIVVELVLKRATMTVLPWAVVLLFW